MAAVLNDTLWVKGEGGEGRRYGGRVRGNREKSG